MADKRPATENRIRLRRPIAFLYPPQPLGQCPMPREFLARFPSLATLYDEALGTLGWDARMRRDARTWSIRPRSVGRSRASHVGTVLFSWAATQLLDEAGITPDVVFGHSLGLHSALTVSGATPIIDALGVVDRTAEFIALWGPELDGVMLAAVGFTPDEVMVFCDEINRSADASVGDGVFVAIVNSQRQVVVSGERWAVDRLARRMRAKQVWSLARIPGRLPLHTPLMARLTEQCADLVAPAHCHVPHVPPIHPTTGLEVRTVSGVEQLWRTHLIGMVDFVAALRRMEEMGVQTYIEVGVGQTLRQLGRWFRRDLPVVGVDTPDNLERILRARVE